MNINTKELRRLAEAATPGPWSTMMRGRYWHEEEADVIDANGDEVSGAEFVKPIGDVPTTRGGIYADDATFIAAANPVEVLALLDEIVRLRADAERYRHIKPMFRVMSLHIAGQHTYSPLGGFARMRGPSLDAAIDAAIAAEKGKT